VQEDIPKQKSVQWLLHGDSVEPKKGWEKAMDMVHPHVKFTASREDEHSTCHA